MKEKNKNATVCHHCGKTIKYYNKVNGGGYWAHPIYTLNGKTLTEGNELVQQQCFPGTSRLEWATPKREANRNRDKVFIYCNKTNRYLDTYGPTKDEITWSARQESAFVMTREEANTRIATVVKFFPRAEIVLFARER